MVDAEAVNISAGTPHHQKVNTSTAKDTDDARKERGVPDATSAIGLSVPQTLLAGTSFMLP